MRHVVAMAIVAPAAAFAFYYYRKCRKRRTSSYLTQGKISDRKFMISCFLRDVATPMPSLPARSPGVVRFVTFNINIMTGPDWNTEVSAATVADLLREIDADVIVLQEAPNHGLDTLWDERLAAPLARTYRTRR